MAIRYKPLGYLDFLNYILDIICHTLISSCFSKSFFLTKIILMLLKSSNNVYIGNKKRKEFVAYCCINFIASLYWRCKYPCLIIMKFQDCLICFCFLNFIGFGNIFVSLLPRNIFWESLVSLDIFLG